MALDLSSLRNAVVALEQTLQAHSQAASDSRLTDNQRNAIRAGVVQHFEFTYELCWKFMKRWLADPGGCADLDALSRRQLFRLAAEARLIADASPWFDFHAARNLTSHTYDSSVANQVAASAPPLLTAAAALLAELERRND